MHSARIIELEKQRDELLSRPDGAHALQSLLNQVTSLRADNPEDKSDCYEYMIGAIEQAITDTTKPTKPARAEGDHVHELGSCSHCDTKPVKPFPMPGQVWEFDGTDPGPFLVTGLRWFHGNAEAEFECGVAGIKHMMELDAWTCVKAPQ